MSRTKEAMGKQREARMLRSRGRASDHLIANGLEREAQNLLVPESTELALGEALTPYDDDRCLIHNTLENPDGVAIDASSARMDLLTDANVLELGVDMADSVNAANSAEKMLSHQAAACHSMALQLLTRANNGDLPPVEIARLTNASCRLMESFQTALVTLQKLRTGNRQVHVIQHIDNRGGQAVVTGRVERGVAANND